jgi:hypothetical protein
MPISSGDIQFRLSGGAPNTDPAASLGGAMSTVSGGLIATDVANALFDNVSADEAAGGDTEYRGIYVRNNHGSLTWGTVKAWIETQTVSAGTSLEIGLATEAAGAAMATIPNEGTAPAGVTFSAPADKAAGLAVGNLTPGQYRGLWVKRIVDDTTGPQADSGKLRAEGDTPA